MPAACEWTGGCASDPLRDVPDGVPVFNLLNLDGRHDGVYCRVHAQVRVREMGKALRAGRAADQEGTT